MARGSRTASAEDDLFPEKLHEDKGSMVRYELFLTSYAIHHT